MTKSAFKIKTKIFDLAVLIIIFTDLKYFLYNFESWISTNLCSSSDHVYKISGPSRKHVRFKSPCVYKPCWPRREGRGERCVEERVPPAPRAASGPASPAATISARTTVSRIITHQRYHPLVYCLLNSWSMLDLFYFLFG